jgi:uncharacterized membrane protein YoaK (UPF0700 family)
MKVNLPALLSLNAGYVDTAGFLALQGLFTAHVTGNFVTLGASLVFGTSGATAKLLALPTFCVVVILARLAGGALPRLGLPVLRSLMTLQVLLLAIGAVMAIELGPFANGDTGAAIATGLTLVAAMAIQNAVHRVHFASAPPSTLMTGTTTQMMLDIADLMRGMEPEPRAVATARLRKMALSVGAFAIGCAAAGLIFAGAGVWCFIVPPAIGFGTLLVKMEE